MKTQSFARQKHGSLHFACRQCPSILFVWNPSFTNYFEWFTNRCSYPCFSKFIYAFQQSDTTVVPFAMCFCIKGNNVASSHLSVYCCHKTLSRILFNSAENPLSLNTWYFLFPNLLSSIWTTLPFSLCSKSVTSHVSQQKLSQSTAGSDV